MLMSILTGSHPPGCDSNCDTLKPIGGGWWLLCTGKVADEPIQSAGRSILETSSWPLLPHVRSAKTDRNS